MYEAATPYISKEHREFLKSKKKNVLIRVTQFALLILFSLHGKLSQCIKL